MGSICFYPTRYCEYRSGMGCEWGCALDQEGMGCELAEMGDGCPYVCYFDAVGSGMDGEQPLCEVEEFSTALV